VDRIVLLADRPALEVLPALEGLLVDAKSLDLSVVAVADALALTAGAIVVDAAENPGQGFAVLRALEEHRPEQPIVAVIERRDLERFAWETVADELLYPATPEAELRLRLAMLRRRLGVEDETVVRLGELVLETDSYRFRVGTRPLDLTYKEFELLRFLAERRGRVFTRPALLREVWGYDFYGGTRTVDVHIRRLRAKLGPTYESLIETVRGVGYRATDGD
jgi:DNA-binding response OmpR family regulator